MSVEQFTPDPSVIEQRLQNLSIPALGFAIEQAYVLVRMPSSQEERVQLLQLEARHLHDAFSTAIKGLPSEPFIETTEDLEMVVKEPTVKRVLDLLFAHGIEKHIPYVSYAQSIFRDAEADKTLASHDPRNMVSYIMDFEVHLGKEEEEEEEK